MPNDRVHELKSFIFAHLRENGFTGDDKDLDHLLFQTPSTLRLRQPGYTVLKKFYASEEFLIEGQRLTGRELMTLKWHVGWPYWLPGNHSRLVLFTIRDSFYLKLQGGDVKKWLAQVYARKNQQD